MVSKVPESEHYDIYKTANGKYLNGRTLKMLWSLEEVMGSPAIVLQGSYNPGGVAVSGGTHDGGGALDLAVSSFPGKTMAAKLTAARRRGFAAWHRKKLVRNGKLVWNEHIHMVALGDKDASPAAKAQMAAYRNRRNGLADNGPDDGPRVKIQTWEEFKAGRRTETK